MNKLRILIVEDERVVARDIAQQIQVLGHEVAGSTADGEEAVRLAGELQPGLVLMDIQLAGTLDGIDAALAIRRQWAIPVIFLTAFASAAVVERAKTADPCGYIVKPFSQQELGLGIVMAQHQHEVEMRLRQAHSELAQTNGRLAQSLARAEELAVVAETANRTKSAFLASMSHELRTPLNAINGVAATLLERAPQAEDAREVKLILDSGQTLLGIIEEILDYSGLQAGQPRLSPRSCDLLDVVTQALRMAGESARQRRLDLVYSIAGNLPARVVTDPQRLLQILLNLLQHALKQTERGRVHLGCTVRRLPTGSQVLAFTVADSGAGLCAGAMARLFQPFADADTRQSAHAGGVGLGLVIAQSYARLMGGDIVARSKPGRGSLFRCTITAGVEEAGFALARHTAPELRGGRMLIVAEDTRRGRLLGAAVQTWGMEPVLCRSRDVTADLLQSRGPFALAILDLEAVRSEKGDLSRWLAHGAPGHSLPVVWMTRPGAPDQPKTAGPSVNLASPLDLAELARVLGGLATHRATRVEAPATAAPKRKLGERLPLRILAADDVGTNRQMLRFMLRQMGYEVKMVENGAEVLAELRLAPYDLVLLDIEMPVMDGLTAAREIALLFPDKLHRPRLVSVTANALPGDRAISLAAGMDDYLTKPVLPKTLEHCLVNLFHKDNAATEPALLAPPPAAVPATPWIDPVHFAAMLPGLPPAQLAAILREMHAVATRDFESALPRIEAVCTSKDNARLAELVHGLKGCFLMLGWPRLANRCIDVLGQARKGEFAGWESLPGELRQLFAASAQAMHEHLISLEAPAPELAVAARRDL